MKSFSGRTLPAKLLRGAVVVIVVLVIVHLFLQYLNLLVFGEQNGLVFELSNRFDLDDESSAPTWYSQFLLLLVAGACGLAARLQSEKTDRRRWGGAGLIALAFSVDETMALHEFGLQWLHTSLFGDEGQTLTRNAWLFVGPVILLLAVWLGAWIIRRWPRRTAGLSIFGGSLFLTGSIAVDYLTSGVDKGTYLHQGFLVAAEESLELLGAALVLYAAADYLERYHGKKINTASVVLGFRRAAETENSKK